jgi:hypothetical protein
VENTVFVPINDNGAASEGKNKVKTSVPKENLKIFSKNIFTQT